MRTIEINGIKIYELSKGSAIPEYLGKRRQQNLRAKHQMISSQLQIIHDLTMPDITTCISLSPDGKFMFLLGAYSPRVRCYELEQLSMKFERNCDELPSKIAHLGKDYSKFVILEGERTLAFHAAGGIHHKVPCENVIKDIIYSPFKSQLFLPDNQGIISVLDVERGYLSSKIIDSTNSTPINSAVFNEITDIFFTGHVNGLMHGYDCRSAKIISSIDVRKAPISEFMKKSYVPEVCKLAFKDPLKIGIGTDKGMFHLYDIRNNSRPFSSRDLDYEFPIKSIIFHDDLVIAAVKSVFKIWQPIEYEEGKIIATYDTLAEINDLCQYPKSGLFFAASNVSQIGTYFIPKIADAPFWCQQLSNLIVDVETDSQSMYDTHTFITREEVDELNLVDKIGTGALRAYMHGFYVSKETYQRARNALLVAARNREEVLLNDASKNQQQSMLATGNHVHDPLDDVPDPRINVQLKFLINDKRFADLFTCDAFILDPTCRAYEQAVINMKHLAKKRSKKILLKHQAKKSKLMVDNVSDGVIGSNNDVITSDCDIIDHNDDVISDGDDSIDDDNDDGVNITGDDYNIMSSAVNNDGLTSVDSVVRIGNNATTDSDDNEIMDDVISHEDDTMATVDAVISHEDDTMATVDDVISHEDDTTTIMDDVIESDDNMTSVHGDDSIKYKDCITSIELDNTIRYGKSVKDYKNYAITANSDYGDDVTVISDEISEDNADITSAGKENDDLVRVNAGYEEELIVISDEDDVINIDDEENVVPSD